MLDYLKGTYYNYIYGVLYQKMLVRDTPPLHQIGGDVKDLTIIVTGPTSGIGWTTAAELARRGAHVVLACRSASKGEAMVAQLRKEAAAAGSPAPHLEVNLLDLASLESVRQFVERWQQRPLHVLVNNAGMFNMGVGRSETKDGLEVHMQTNHLAHFLLTLGLLPALREAAQQQQQQQGGFMPRIVTVASAMHHLGYRLQQDPLSERSYSAELAYGNSKLAQVLFTAELNRRLAAAGGGVQALSLHPGNVLTNVVQSLPPAIQSAYRAIMARVLLTPEQGARATVYAASDPGAFAAAAATGGYLDCSAQPVQPHALAADPQLAAWLWQWSSQQVKLPQGWDLPVSREAPAGQAS
ncbi:hypothetical protein OEZ85_010187 [Tetradesmus obliquus]|uniref:Uncharacterized protein n=1 Tax=Tetradesmus obliquus TaxID=3088 RepID=A0ABY8TLW1_TETOB|nr:hypothetical protein OEZ85_010187 [Tetradesmus obliquus]